MTFDEHRGVTLLFGGADAERVRDDTWAWDGRAWRRETWRGPGPRTFPIMVWHAGRRVTLLFGGRRVLFGRDGETGTFLADSWILDADGWRQRDGGPSPRAEAAAAYDDARRVVVLFGGYNDAGGVTTRLGDTWEWDGERWQQRASSGPAPRNGAAMSYDPRARRVVLFGGSGGPRADTWAWDGRAWTEIATPATPGRFNSVAQFDRARQQLVRTTGWDGAARVRETWLFERGRWRLASTAGPPARNHSSLSYDGRRGRLVLHGGHDGTLVFGDTWEWDGGEWQERATVAPQRRIDNGH